MQVGCGHLLFSIFFRRARGSGSSGAHGSPLVALSSITRHGPISIIRVMVARNGLAVCQISACHSASYRLSLTCRLRLSASFDMALRSGSPRGSWSSSTGQSPQTIYKTRQRSGQAAIGLQRLFGIIAVLSCCRTLTSKAQHLPGLGVLGVDRPRLRVLLHVGRGLLGTTSARVVLHPRLIPAAGGRNEAATSTVCV